MGSTSAKCSWLINVFIYGRCIDVITDRVDGVVEWDLQQDSGAHQVQCIRYLDKQ